MSDSKIKFWRNVLVSIGLVAIALLSWKSVEYFNQLVEANQKAQQIESHNQKLERVKSLVKERDIFGGVLVALEATGESLDRYQEVTEQIEESLQRSVPYLRERQQLPSDTTAYAFSPDNKHLITGHEDGSIRFWLPDGTPTEKVIQTGKNSQKSHILDIIFDAEGKTILVSNGNKELQIWNVETLSLSDSWSLGMYSSQLAISPDGETIVVAGGEKSGEICIWDSKGNVIHSPKQAHWVYISDIAFASDGREFVTSDSWGRVRHWSRTGQPLNKLEEDFNHPIFAVTFPADSEGEFYSKVHLISGLYKDFLQEDLKLSGHTIGDISKLYIPDKSDLNSNTKSFFSNKFISAFIQPWDASFSSDDNSKYFVVSYRGGFIQVYNEYAHPFGSLIEVKQEVNNPIFASVYVVGHVITDEKKPIRLWTIFPKGRSFYELKEMEDWEKLVNHACQMLKSHSILKNPITETEKNAAKTCNMHADLEE